MTGFKNFLFREMFLEQNKFWWATDAKFQENEEVVAGAGPIRTLDQIGTSLEKLYDRIRQKANPQLPSRIGAVFLSHNEATGRRWKKMLRKSHLYLVELLSGKPYMTDSDRWGDVMFRVSKKIHYGHVPKDKHDDFYQRIASGDKSDSSIEDYDGDAATYWNSGRPSHYEKDDTFDPQEDIELPEVIVAKGSKIKIIGEIT